MSNIEALEADQSGEKSFLEEEKDVESFDNSLYISTPPESEKLPWCVGDIVWSKIPGHPWWPSLIANEPSTAVYFKIKGRTRYYHVQFFGTEMLRGWVTERSILKYEGKSHFLSLRLSVHGKPHKIGKKQLPVWENAIKMADEALLLNHDERQVSCNVFIFNTVETSDISDPETGYFTSEFEDTATPDKLNDSHNDITSGNDEPPIKKTKVDSADRLSMDDVKFDSAKPDNNSPGKSSKSTVKQTTLTTPKQIKAVPNKQLKNKVNKAVNKELTKLVSKTPDQQDTNKLDKPINNNKLDKQAANILDKQVKNKKVKDNCIFVNHSPTAYTVQESISPKTPETGKRKRGRPRKYPIVPVGDNKINKAVPVAKKQKIQPSANTLCNNRSNSTAESEKSDGASDTNSISGMDIDSRKSKNKEFVCAVCEKPDNLLFCEGICNSAYHKNCLTRDVLNDKFICDECTTGNHTCFVCGKAESVIKCSSQNCGKYYHLDCIKKFDPKIKDENFICPLHHCNVCGTKKSSSLKRRLTCCTRCPVAYHSSTCIVAGSLPITTKYLVCNRHFIADPKKAHHLHVNVNWCFVCSIGGTLICCESCPAAFHPECIEETGIPEGRFFCRDCKDGKEMLYGEIVWVKLGMYRWWPAQICNPNNIPTNIQRMKHQPGEFPVQFLGSHDYYWIHRGRVFSYQEGDKGSIGGGGKYLAEIFKKALVEAQEKYTEWQKAQEEKAEKDLEKLSKKPAVYKHIKINRYTTATRYVIEESDWPTCDCSFNDENPCGPDSHCLNRILYVECSPLKCHAKEKCQNQCFVKRQYLDCEPFRAERRGWGLKANADAKKGQFVIEYVGELINDETCRERVRKGINDGVINYYMLTIDKDCIIDAGPMGNLSRFMNHCCDPNCETQKWTVNGEVRVGLFAKRDIKKGEELVFDYQLDCLGNEKKKCSCGSENCSGFLGVRPKTQHALKLQEEKKKNQDSKKKKKKTANKKNVDGTRGKPQARSLVPGDLGSSEDITHFDITPEAIPASELEFDEDEAIIEQILICNNEQLNKSNLETFNETRPVLESTKQESQTTSISPDHQTSTIPVLDNVLNCNEKAREVNQTASFPNVPSSILSNLETSFLADIPCVKSDSNSQLEQISQSNPVISGFVNSSYPVKFANSSLICPNSPTTPIVENLGNLPASTFNCHPKLPSLPHNVPTSPVQRSLQNTTLSQFTPKDIPFVSHAFHNLGPKILGSDADARYGTSSTFSPRPLSTPHDSYPNTSLAVKSRSQHL